MKFVVPSSGRTGRTQAFHLKAGLRTGSIAGWLTLSATAAVAQPVDFNRQVKPILSGSCFKCHGPDEAAREARLRLDVREVATQPAKSGLVAIVPGRPEESELFLRVTDPSEPMPPVETGKKLKPHEIEILRRWIAEGANYAAHWSFVRATRPIVPLAAVGADLSAIPTTSPLQVADESAPTRSVSPLDAFVRARFADHGLAPTREADKSTLLRRLTLDLTGLPPTLAQLDAFLADTRPALTSASSIGCWRRPHMASGWPSTG